MNRLNTLGIGPKIAASLMPWLAISIAHRFWKPTLFRYSAERPELLFYIGAVLLAVGLVSYVLTVRILLKGLRETKLMTSGPYRICQNPLYATICLLIIPALSLLLNSWLILTASAVVYILFRLNIKSEYAELEKFFGEEYINYKKTTPEFFPF